MSETALTVRAPMDLTAQVEEYQNKKYNVLLPVTQFASRNELFVPRLDVVEPDIAGGDFYKQSSKKIGDKWVEILAPSGQFLNKIASASGIQWHPDKCGVAMREDNYVLYKAVGALRQADGQWRVIADEYELDLSVVEEELKLDYSEKAKTKTFQDKMKKEGRDIEYYIKRDLLQKRRHKVALAASGAMNRVIRKALTLKSTYLASEAQNPFAIARFDFQPDYNDPTVRRYASIAAIQAQNDLYGQGSAPMPEDVTPDEIEAADNMMNAGNISDIGNIDFETGEVNSGTVTIDAEIVPPDNDTPPEAWINCEGDDCGGVLEPFRDAQDNEWLPERWAEYTKKLTGRVLCVKCFLKWQKERKGGGK